MDSSSTGVFELLKNEHFVKWVRFPTEESVHYWSKWLSNHPERGRDVEIARRIIQSSKLELDVNMTEDVYDRVLENIFDYSVKKRSKSSPSLSWWLIPLSAAASIALVIFVLAFGYDTNSYPEATIVDVATIVKEAPIGRKTTIMLPDSTIVNLNAGTKIFFPEKFTGDTREVTLIGEAFFDVEHDPTKPFIVRMNGDEVRVLGTSFNIRSYPEDSVVHVAVATGRVSYTIASGDEVLLAPDQMATHLFKDGSLSTGKVDKLEAFGWKDRIIYFKGTSFDDVMKELERWYGVEIKANGNFKKIGTFSGEFRNETLFQVLKGLSFVYQFDFNIEGKKITLTRIPS